MSINFQSCKMFLTKGNLNDFNEINMFPKLNLQNYVTPTCKLGFRNRSFHICTFLRFGFRTNVDTGRKFNETARKNVETIRKML